MHCVVLEHINTSGPLRAFWCLNQAKVMVKHDKYFYSSYSTTNKMVNGRSVPRMLIALQPIRLEFLQFCDRCRLFPLNTTLQLFFVRTKRSCMSLDTFNLPEISVAILVLLFTHTVMIILDLYFTPQVRRQTGQTWQFKGLYRVRIKRCGGFAIEFPI